MKVKKLGHCCLVIEVKGKRIMTDPGSYTIIEQELEKNIDLILITHEHADHLHTDSLKKILLNNPNATIVTNTSVGKIIGESGISYEVLEDGNESVFKEISLSAHGDKHQEIYEDFGMVQNTGYFIEGILFYPGDAFVDPGKGVEILALPVLAPWLKIKDSIDYAITVKPKVVFPVHDWNAKSTEFLHKIPNTFLSKKGITFTVLPIGEVVEF